MVSLPGVPPGASSLMLMFLASVISVPGMFFAAFCIPSFFVITISTPFFLLYLRPRVVPRPALIVFVSVLLSSSVRFSFSRIVLSSLVFLIVCMESVIMIGTVSGALCPRFVTSSFCAVAAIADRMAFFSFFFVDFFFYYFFWCWWVCSSSFSYVWGFSCWSVSSVG